MYDSTGSLAPTGIDALEQLGLEHSFTEISDDRGFLIAFDAVDAYQRRHVPLYSKFCDSITDVEGPHYLPIRAFKEATLCAGDSEKSEAVFLSSGTTGSNRSRHFVRKLSVYRQSICAHFASVFSTGPFTILVHLPRYGQGKNSSLVHMATILVDEFGDEGSAFFLENRTILDHGVVHARKTGTRLILFGAAFGLLSLAETESVELPADALVIETGGMKTVRRELDRSTLHKALARGFGLARARVRSEYGMCELLSQCYTRGAETFYPPPWMRFDIRSVDNPLEPCREGQAGQLAVRDLANMYSVSSILTEDLAVSDGEGFRVLGRMSGAELRGCNLLLDNVTSL